MESEIEILKREYEKLFELNKQLKANYDDLTAKNELSKEDNRIIMKNLSLLVFRSIEEIVMFLPNMDLESMLSNLRQNKFTFTTQEELARNEITILYYEMYRKWQNDILELNARLSSIPMQEKFN